MLRIPAMRYLLPVLMVLVFVACSSDEAPAAPAVVATATPADAPSPTATPPPDGTLESSPAAEPREPGELADVDTLTASAFEHVRALVNELPPRTSTTPGELAAADYLRNQLLGFGYGTSLQGFSVPLIPPEGQFVIVEGAPIRSITARVIQGSAEGVVTGPLVYVDLGREDELPSEGLEGAIALIERGIIPFFQKVRNVAAAGAIGAVIFNNDQGLFSGTFGERLETPTTGISRADGQELVRALRAGPVTATVSLVADMASSQNVVAIKPAASGDAGGDTEIIILGGHYDTVPQAPGANDNAAGAAVAVEIASRLADIDLPYELRVVLFGSEELGLLGSRHYVSTLSPAEIARTTLMLNLDALGAGQLEVIGDRPLVNAVMEIAESEGIRMRQGVTPLGASSDHASFRAVGIPVVFIVGSDGSRLHTPNDTILGVRQELLGQAVLISLRGLLGGFTIDNPPSVFSLTAD
ncbi:MAG: M20/M25/M40 family metallo-hydrolase [Chloroflexi bacterium]|nr:M20/M25/M40 family metallo-hydrolase [Chloroflexota bacterium]